MKRIVVYFFIFVWCRTTAQDPQISQYYSAPQYLNPAFTGLTAEHRFAINYRSQWPGVKKNFNTFLAGYDYNASEANSGIGIIVMQDNAGIGNMSHSMAGFNYAYRFTVRKLSEIRAGIGANFNSVTVGANKLLFNDQLITGSAVSLDANNIGRKNFLDLNAGILFNSEKIWAGITAKHLNQPNTSVSTEKSQLPLFIGVHGGYRYIIEAKGSSKSQLKKYVTVSFNYKHQLKNDQLDLGFYYFHAPVNFGVWYRGIPFKKYNPYGNSESLVLLLGFEVPNKNLRIGYSFDLTVSPLALTSTKGAHEIALVYEIAEKAKYKSRRVLVTVPKF